MAEIVLSIGERERIDAIVCELTSTLDEFLADARTELTSQQWALVIEYATARLRRVLELGTSLHAVVDAHEGRGLAQKGRGRDSFVRAALDAWADRYSSIAEPWRLAMVCERMPGGEKRLLAEVGTLEAMAANRLFTSLDEQCESLLTSDS